MYRQLQNRLHSITEKELFQKKAMSQKEGEEAHKKEHTRTSHNIAPASYNVERSTNCILYILYDVMSSNIHFKVENILYRLRRANITYVLEFE